MREKFSGDIKLLSVVQSKAYEWNDKKCDAEVVKVWTKADGTHTFALIRKINSKWDFDSNGKPADVSYSICWEETDGKIYSLGLPADADVLAELKNLI